MNAQSEAISQMISAEAPRPIAVSVILPTFNERENIIDLIEAIRANLDPAGFRYEVLVVDDSSPDGTAASVTERYGVQRGTSMALGDAGSRITLIVRTANKGLANSIREGLERAAGEVLVVMDTDFNHDPAMIPQMVDLLRWYDLVIGSRFVMRGGMEDHTRYLFSLLYNYFVRFILRTQIQDNLSGFFAVRRDQFLTLRSRFDRIFYGYGDYFIRLLLVAWRSNWKILEVPVFYILRRHGDSKTGFWRIFRDYTRAVLAARVRGV